MTSRPLAGANSATKQLIFGANAVRAMPTLALGEGAGAFGPARGFEGGCEN